MLNVVVISAGVMNTMPGIEFKDVARLLTSEEFARRELRMRGKRAQCPFHHGQNYNLMMNADGTCHCFVCGRTADVVQLAAAVWHTSQMDAARMLNDDFNLGLTAEMPTDEQRQRRQQERDRRKAEQREQREAWARACDDEREARAKLERFTAADADKPEFDQALRQMAAAQTTLDVMWAGV